MKIGILTYYNVHNHGAVLQANALRNILESMGHQCEFLTFERDYSMLSNKQSSKYKIGIRSIPFYAKYLFEKGLNNIIYNLNKNKVLNEYRKKNLLLGEKYNNFQGDMIIIGSDEVFSLEVGVNPFLYGNDLKSERIISYAGSFGTTKIEDVKMYHLEKMLFTGFDKMEAISVRDENSQMIVKSITNKDAVLVCDPVILYGYKNEMCEFQKKLDKYIVIYSYDKNMNLPEETRKIIEYARSKNLKIISVGYYHSWCKNIQATPNELLCWIKNAEMVITDTFHGSVISIICNTPMVVKVRGNKNKLDFLLKEYGLSNRIINDFSQLKTIAEQPVDFDEVNKKIDERRKTSMSYLMNALGS